MNKKKINGFTLVEILMTIGILGIIMGAGLIMFTSILRGSAKTRVLNEVKQNGSYALNLMERAIHNAKKIEDDYTHTTITILNPDPDDEQTTFACTGGLITSDGSSLINSDKVMVDDCANFFNVTPGEPNLSPDQVEINFTLISKGTSNRPEDQASAKFKTTVILRNY